MTANRYHPSYWRMWTVHALLFAVLLIQTAVSFGAEKIYLRAPWNLGEWWQPSTFPPSHNGFGRDRAVDFNRVSRDSVVSLNETWPYASEEGVEVEVRAAHDGTVIYGTNWPRYGKFISLISSEHRINPTHASIYAHLERYAVPNRKVVRAGEVIAYLDGQTGRSRCDASLHFEYRIDNVRQNIEDLVFDGQPVTMNYQRVDSQSQGDRYIGMPIEARGDPVDAVPAFPGAEGFGAYTVGGRGGRVIEVTNLNASGPGSLTAALLAKGPRTIIFRVSGTIDLQRQTIVVRSPYLTVAGQTAPGGGITIKGGNIFLNTHDIVMRYLRIRSGPGGYGGDNSNQGDCIQIYGKNAHNIILDHLSLSWSTDETLSIVQEAHNVTVQRCMITEPLNYVPAPYTHPSGAHSKAIFQSYRASRVTYNKNLIAHTIDRVPTITSGDAQFVNNLIYNCNKASIFAPYNMDTPLYVQFMGNHFQQGPSNTLKEELRFISFTQSSAGGTIEGGVMPFSRFMIPPGYNSVQLSNSTVLEPRHRYVLDGAWVSQSAAGVTFVTNLAGFSPVVITAPGNSANMVLQDVGVNRPYQDAVDHRILGDVQNGTGKIINEPGETVPPGADPWPVLPSTKSPEDTDHDGMPDEWELQHGLNPLVAADGATASANPPYTNLERYLSELSGDPSLGSQSIAQNISARHKTDQPAFAALAPDNKGCSLLVLALLSTLGCAGLTTVIWGRSRKR